MYCKYRIYDFAFLDNFNDQKKKKIYIYYNTRFIKKIRNNIMFNLEVIKTNSPPFKKKNS